MRRQNLQNLIKEFDQYQAKQSLFKGDLNSSEFTSNANVEIETISNGSNTGGLNAGGANQVSLSLGKRSMNNSVVAPSDIEQMVSHPDVKEDIEISSVVVNTPGSASEIKNNGSNSNKRQKTK